ncbi:GNAT family N-acetyltransferase [Pontimicrobium sp. IMCC45349]|uniref:GNAT family N-acetyltransferase n=1 Tax=Pontimicrobium sp. IMCC45349 TaxID=3391574 RepID=UPI0039A3BF51
MNIVQATLNHINDLAPLFDAYRIFYKQTSNLDAAKAFLKSRIENKESTIYLCYDNDKAIGFTQLYPLFSSVSMERMYLLNDLYVDANYRSKGVGKMLIDATKLLCKTNNYKGIAIQTAHDNPAQHLYQRLGFESDSDLHFFWTNR